MDPISNSGPAQSRHRSRCERWVFSDSGEPAFKGPYGRIVAGPDGAMFFICRKGRHRTLAPRPVEIREIVSLPRAVQ